LPERVLVALPFLVWKTVGGGMPGNVLLAFAVE
jgi:hypothetical protein